MTRRRRSDALPEQVMEFYFVFREISDKLISKEV
jgi:hypothetical protein